MNAERAWLGFAIVVGVGLALQTLAPANLSSVSESSFDTAPRGNAGLFELLTRIDQTQGRWVSGLSMPAESSTIWWIAPGSACESVDGKTLEAAGEAAEGADEEAAEEAADAEEEVSLGSPFQVTVRPWIEAGGTALVWLAHSPLPGAEEGDPPGGDPDESDDEAEGTDAESARREWEEDLAEHRVLLENGTPEVCHALLGFALPARSHLGLEGGQLPEEGRYSPIVFSVGRAVAVPAAFDYAGARTLPGPTLTVFDREEGKDRAEGKATKPGDAASEEDGWDGWEPLWVEANNQAAFALHRRLGEGQLIVAADARVVSNARLAHVDSAPFVLDWVNEFGSPWIDEHAHGIVAETGTFRYLMTSPAWAACLGLVVLGLLFVWRGQAWPVRAVSEADLDAPTLGRFVDSVAHFYGQSQDYQAVFERYREVCLARVRRALGLSPGTSSEIILASLRARGENWPALREAGLSHLLTREIPISSAQDLDRNAARLEDLVRVVQESGRASRGYS